jgi:kynurenine formamidase
MDAPAHFLPGKTTLEKIPAEKFLRPALMLNVQSEAERNPDYQLMVKRIEVWEETHGKIPAGAMVVLRTGWGAARSGTSWRGPCGHGMPCRHGKKADDVSCG